MDKNTYMVITIDTEQDVDRNYRHTGTYKNIEEGMDAISSIFDDFNCKATWLVTPDVAIQYKDKMKDLVAENHEIGCHVHPEYFSEKTLKNVRPGRHLFRETPGQQRDMIQKATEIIKESTGTKPTSFRAGKYGADDKTFRILKDEGYLIDTSVTPTVSWGRENGPDWSKCDIRPHFLQAQLLEVPITILRILGIQCWLRPSVSTTSMLEKIFEVARAKQEGYAIVNMMFHSMESIDPNPFIKSKVFLKRLRAILEYAHSQDTEFVTLKQLYDIYSKYKNPSNIKVLK